MFYIVNGENKTAIYLHYLTGESFKSAPSILHNIKCNDKHCISHLIQSSFDVSYTSILL